MTQGLHNLKAGTKRRTRKRVGRGNASGWGTYSARGQKGQRSRSGGKGGLKRRGMKAMMQNKPKIGGFKSPYQELVTVDLAQLEKHFEAGSVVNPKRLSSVGLIPKSNPGVKVLSRGKLTKKLSVSAHAFSETAQKAIEEAGGSVTVVAADKKRPKRK